MSNGIDFSGYARSYAGGAPDLRGIGESLSRIVDAHGEARKANIQAKWNKHMESQLGTFEDLAYKDLDQLLMPNGLFSKPFMTAGRAYLNARTHFLGGTDDEGKRIASTAGLTKKEQREIQASPFLNPIAYKQQYDQMFASYLPQIIKKIEQYQEDKGLSAREMQIFVNNNPHLKNFLATYAPEGSPLQMAAQSYAPEGFIGGITSGVMDSPIPYIVGAGPAMTLASEGTKRAATMLGAKGAWATSGSKSISELSKKLLKSTNPFSTYSGSKGTTFLGKKLSGEVGRAKWLKTKAGKKLLNEISKKNNLLGSSLERSWQSRLKNAKKSAISATSKSDEAWKALQSHIKKSKSFNRNVKPGYTKFLMRPGTEGGKLKATYDAARKNKNAANLALKKATKKVNDFAGKGTLELMKKVVKRRGTKGLVRLLANKVGWGTATMLAGRLAAGTLLSGSGIGTAAGIAMNTWTLMEIGRVLQSALKETGGVRRPDKMVFGGK